MKVTYAAFHIEYKKKSYSVSYDVSAVSENVTQVVTTVSDAQGTLGTWAGSGRQIISPWNAKEALKKCLTEKGIYKPHKPEPQTEQTPELPDLSDLENI